MPITHIARLMTLKASSDICKTCGKDGHFELCMIDKYLARRTISKTI